VALPPPGVSARWGLTAPVPLWQVTGIGWGPGSQAGNLGNGGKRVPVRPESEIAAAVSEYEDRLWYFRSAVVPADETSEQARQRASRRATMESRYGERSLADDDPAIVIGRLSALRWVLGEGWTISF